MAPTSPKATTIPSCILAGVCYGASLFMVGMIFGIVRTLFVEPLIGHANGVLIELPVIFVVAWFVSRYLMTFWRIGLPWPRRLLVCCVAFGVGMTLELAFGMLVQNRAFSEVLALLLSDESRFGLIGQVLVFLIPFIQSVVVLSSDV